MTPLCRRPFRRFRLFVRVQLRDLLSAPPQFRRILDSDHCYCTQLAVVRCKRSHTTSILTRLGNIVSAARTWNNRKSPVFAGLLAKENCLGAHLVRLQAGAVAVTMRTLFCLPASLRALPSKADIAVVHWGLQPQGTAEIAFVDQTAVLR